MNEEQKVKYRKLGGGSFRTHNERIIKPNQVFWEYPSEIPEQFKDLLERVAPLRKKKNSSNETEVEAEPEEVNETTKPTQHTYYKEHTGWGWYDVYDETGKKINEKSLREDSADELIKSLE